MRNTLVHMLLIGLALGSAGEAQAQGGRRGADISQAIDARWLAETRYQQAAGSFWKAYQEAEDAYQEVKEAGANLELLRESSSFSDAMARHVAQQIEGNLACKAVQAVAGPAAGAICDSKEASQTAFDLAKWFALDLVMVEQAIKNRVIIARKLKPALDVMNKAEEALNRAKEVVRKRNAGGIRISSPGNGQSVWDGTVGGAAKPGQKVKVYIFTDRSYLQGECTASESGAWKLDTYPTIGAVNRLYAVGINKKGQAVSCSPEVEIPEEWLRPRESR